MKRKSLNNINMTEPSNHIVKKDLTGLANASKKNSFFTKKRNVVLGLMASTMVAIPVAVGITQIERNIASYKFDGKSFSSVGSAFDYVKSNSEVKEYQSEGMNSKWSVNINGVKRSFDTPEALREYLFTNQIKAETYNTSLDLDKYVDKSTGILGLDDSLWASMNAGNSSSAAKQTVYEKSNGGFSTESDEALKSYFKVQDAYYFNNMYFNSKETLRNYLVSDYLVNNTGSSSFNSITIEAPNGAKSNPISLKDTSASGAMAQITSFINSNIEKVVTYTNTKTNKKVNINSKNIEAVINDVNLEDLDYQHVLSNQGESRYIVDNSINDEHNLIGPYFYKGNLDVASFTNKSMWKKVNGVSKQVYQESAVDTLVGNFFTSILNDDNQLNKQETVNGESKPHIFRTLLQTADSQSLDEWYLEQINAFNNDLYVEIVNALNSLMNGKKFNTFYKIPAMYSFVMQRLINMNAPQDIIALTVGYFSKVADFLQDALELILLDDSLLVRSKDNKKFNVKEFFGIGNSEFDLSASTEYFLNEIKTYDNLIAAMSAYVGATNNINSLGGTLVFSGYDQEYLFEFNIISKETFYSNYDKFANIFTTFSKTNYSEMILSLVNSSTREDIIAVKNSAQGNIEAITNGIAKLNTANGNSISEIIKGVAAKNTYLFVVVETTLMAEIDEYINNKTLDPNGMLVQLDTTRLNGLVDLYKNSSNGQDVSIYQAYLYSLMDYRSGFGVFNTSSAVSNKNLYDRNVVRLTGLTLASAGGVVYIINKLHDVFSSTNDVVDGAFDGPNGITRRIRDLFDTVKDSVKNKVTQIKHRIPHLMRTWHINRPTTIKWSSFKFMETLGKVGDIFSAAAPFLGVALAGFEIFTIVFDLLKVTNTQDFYVYTTADGTEFIWDGGLTTSKYFGLEVKQVTGIEAMKLVDPVQITKPQLSDFYYFNQIKYFDVNQLKRDQVLQIVSDDTLTLNKNFTRSYTFDDISNTNNATYPSIQEVVNAVVADMGITYNESNKTYDFSKINTSSRFISNTSYMLSSGIGSNTGGQNDVIAGNIVDNIRPTKVAQLPIMTNGKISGKNESPFVFPGKVWTPNGVTDNTSQAASYITDNSANQLKDGSSSLPPNGNISQNNFKIADPLAAANASKDALFNIFKTKATPNSKVVLKSDALLNNEFNKMSSEIQEKQVFKATLPDLGTVYFANQADAQKWILRNVNFEKYTDVVSDATYVYNGMYFGSTSELKNWLQSVIIVG